MPVAVNHAILIGMANLFTKFKSKRRCVQFSLRTGLIVLTASCVALSLWVVPIERQRRAVAAIERLGPAWRGNVRYVKPAASEIFPVTYLRRWLPPDYFDEIEFVDLTNTQVTDVGLVHLQELTSVQQLWLGNTQVTDAGLAHLQGLTDLQELTLDGTQVTDAGLAHLQGLKGLQGLNLDDTPVTDAGLTHLRGLTGLQLLLLYNTHVTDDGLAQLRKALPNCQIFGP